MIKIPSMNWVFFFMNEYKMIDERGLDEYYDEIL